MYKNEINMYRDDKNAMAYSGYLPKRKETQTSIKVSQHISICYYCQMY
jgi:hypothetical protein